MYSNMHITYTHTHTHTSSYICIDRPILVGYYPRMLLELVVQKAICFLFDLVAETQVVTLLACGLWIGSINRL